MTEENKNYKYGSIPDGEDPEETFPIENTQYIVSTAEEKRKKCVQTVMPLTIFTLLMGSIVFALSRGFNHLYPKSPRPPIINTDDETTGYMQDIDTTASTPNSPGGAHPATGTGEKAFWHQDCVFHDKCVDLGLTGVCCPTPEGVNLDCCND